LDQTPGNLLERAQGISPALSDFLDQAGFPRVWPGIKNTAPDAARSLAQFHRWFDGFKTIKLLHYLRDNGYPEVEMFEAIRRMLEWNGRTLLDIEWEDARDDMQAQKTLLAFLRQTEAGVEEITE